MNEDLYHLGIKAIILNSKKEILLLKVNVKNLNKYYGEAYWDLPGGRLQKGYSEKETLEREIKEETGFKFIKNITQIGYYLSNIRIPVENESVGLILSVYACNIGDNINDIKLSEEHTHASWFEKSAAADLLAYKYPKDFLDVIRS